jgi:hypothetical protein
MTRHDHEFVAPWNRSNHALIVLKTGELATQSGHCKAGLPLFCAALDLLFVGISIQDNLALLLLQSNSTLCNIHNTILPVKVFCRFRSGCKLLVLWTVSFINIISCILCYKYVPQNIVLCSFSAVGL